MRSDSVDKLFLELTEAVTGEEPCHDTGGDSPSDLYTNRWTSSKNMSKGEAEALCEGCPIYQQCRDYAMAAKEPYFIWGGTRPKDRGIPPRIR